MHILYAIQFKINCRLTSFNRLTIHLYIVMTEESQPSIMRVATKEIHSKLRARCQTDISCWRGSRLKVRWTFCTGHCAFKRF